MTIPFSTSWRVRFNEVDLQGVVHHSQIVTYLEIARIEYWRSLGIPYGNMRDDGYEFIINNIAVRYLKPLRFDDEITVEVGVKSVARASFVLGYRIKNGGGELAVEAETGLLCSKVGSGKPCALPKKYIAKLKFPEM